MKSLENGEKQSCTESFTFVYDVGESVIEELVRVNHLGELFWIRWRTISRGEEPHSRCDCQKTLDLLCLPSAQRIFEA